VTIFEFAVTLVGLDFEMSVSSTRLLNIFCGANFSAEQVRVVLCGSDDRRGIQIKDGRPNVRARWMLFLEERCALSIRVAMLPLD